MYDHPAIRYIYLKKHNEANKKDQIFKTY